MLIRSERSEGAKGEKNGIIGEERSKNVNDKILVREVELENAPDGKELLKITIKGLGLGAKQVPCRTRVDLLPRHDRSDRPL